MPDKIIHPIQVDGYCARFNGKWGRLQLGTFGSYGIEQLQISLGDSWADLVVYANFVTADGTTPVLVPESGLVDVPPEATAKPGMGNIVLDGTADGVRIYSVNIPYIMLNHSDLSGEAPAPTPDRWQQFVAQVKADADRAEQAAGAASDSAAAADKSAEAAAESAKQAEQAGADIGAAKDDALDAIQQAQDTGVQAVEGETTTGVQAVQQAHQAALDDIATERETALEAVQTEGDKQQSAITSSGAAALEAIGRVEQAAIGQVQQAGQAQLDKINAANALVPTPTQEDAGKAIIVKPDGTGYELGEVRTDAYTKAESDARYAPIEAAIRPTVSGNPATLEHSVAWAIQGLNVYGKSTQQTTTGAQLFDSKSALSNTWIIENSGETERAKGYWTSDYTPVREGSYYLSYKGSNRSAVYDAEKTFVRYLPFSGGGSFNINNGEAYIRFSGSPDNPPETIMLNAGSTALPWEPYTGGKPSPSPDYPQEIVTAGSDGSIDITVSDGADQSQQLIILTPNGLPGIPVDSGGNYTDADGQQWVCDEVDFARGVYVQRIGKVVVDGTELRFSESADGLYWNLPSYSAPHVVGVYSPTLITHFPSGVFQFNIAYNFMFTQPNRISGYFETIDALNQFCVKENSKGNPLTVYYIYDESQETPLSAEELAAYAALRSYNGTTIVSTEAPVAGLSARYVADGAAYIDGKIQAAVTQAVTQAVSITGGSI